MGTFNSEKLITGSPKFIPQVAQKICQVFAQDEFETNMEKLVSGGYDISLSKGGMFKAVVGMKSALKVNIVPQNGNIYVKAGVGIFGQQAIPTAISMLLFWPVIIAQVWGMVQQSKLDDKVIEIAEAEILRLTLEENKPQDSSVACDEAANKAVPQQRVCPVCGEVVPGQGSFCVNCGAKLE